MIDNLNKNKQSTIDLNLDYFTSINLFLNELKDNIDKMNKKYYITTPIYYVNDKPHLGHAYTSLVADTVSRYKKLHNNDVFITGTDEHGQKVEEAAKKDNTSPKDFVDKVSKKFINMTKSLELTNNDFIRTSEDRHKSYVKTIWKN